MADEAMLTTVDNPFDPFNDYDSWYTYDQQLGYNTPALLARVVVSSDALSDTDQDIAISDAMNEIVTENVSGMHRLVYPA